MRFKDIKEAKPAEKEPTFTDKLQNPEKKPSLAQRAKDHWKKGQEWRKVGTGKGDPSAVGIIKNIVGAGKGIKDLVAPKKDDATQAKEKPVAKPKVTPIDSNQVDGNKKYSNDKIMGTNDLRNGSSFKSDKGTIFTFQSNRKGWVPNNTAGRVIPTKKGLDMYNLAKDRSKVEESKNPLVEAEARIQHAEDLVFFQGSAGAKRALSQLKELADGGQEKVTIKWDGSPAVIFGRDADGKFMLSDKGGFGAKGYDGKNKSPEAVEKMFLARPGAQKNPEGFAALAANMKRAYTVMDKATPKDFRGYFKGDMLYFNTPNKEQDMFMFKPQIVQYMVKTDSPIGKRIAQSSVGVVIHRVVDEDGTESPLKDYNIFQGNDLYVLPPVTVSEAPEVDESSIAKLEALINKNSSAIDSFLDKNKLKAMQVSDFDKILYSYINSKVDTGLDNLGKDFIKWLDGSKVSANKQRKLMLYIKENINTFSAMWDVVNGIMKVKDNIIAQLESQDADVVATINGQPGGEGYVLSDPKGDMKLVNRRGFSAANRAQMR